MLSRMLSRLSRRGVGRRGLTLLELVIVMAILAALAGILVPLMPGMLTRAHTSTGVTNLGEIAKAVQMYCARNNDNFPDGFDSLVDSTTNQLADYVPHSTTGTPLPLTVAAPTDNDVSSLTRNNISNVYNFVSKPTGAVGSWNPTFWPYSTDSSVRPTPTPVSTTANLVFLDPTVAARTLGVPNSTASRFVVFGLGKFCTMNGTVMDEAPVWYTVMSGMDPDTVYTRFGLVFQTADANGPLIPARFIGPVEFAKWGLGTKDSNLSMNYSIK